MGYVLDGCPTLHQCCMSVPLRIGVVLISVVGFFWAALFIFGYTDVGRELLRDLGVPNNVGDVMRYVYGVFGVLLCAVHVLLLVGTASQNDSLCEVYVWFMVMFWIAVIVSSLVVAITAAMTNKILFTCVFLLLVFLSVLISFYFTVVVANYRMTLP